MLTRHGWALLLAAAAAFATGRVFALIELYVLGAGLVAAVVAAVLVANTRGARLSVARSTDPPAPVAGEPIEVTMQLTSAGRRGTPELSLWERVGSVGGAAMTLAPLRRGTSASATYTIPATRRGVLTCGPLQARRTDPWGLAARTRDAAGTDEIVVLPRTVPLSPPRIGSPGVLGQTLKAKAVAQGGMDFHGLREYVPGDDPRRISWRASARSTDLLVREHADDELRRVTVALDALIEDEPAFERAVSAAASVLLACAGTELDVRLVSQEVDWRGPDVISVASRGLALIGPAAAPAAVPPGPSTPAGLGVLVLVSDHPAGEFVTAARSVLGRNQTVVTISTGSAGEGYERGHLVVAATSLTQLQSSWNRLVGDARLGVGG